MCLQVFLTGQGKNFCAGIDIASLEADFVSPSANAKCPARARERLLHKIESSQNTISAIENCRWPVIAAVQGPHAAIILSRPCCVLVDLLRHQNKQATVVMKHECLTFCVPAQGLALELV